MGYVTPKPSLFIPFSRGISPKVNAIVQLEFDGLVSLFNGISTFLGYLMPKPFSYLTHSWEDKGVHTFPKGICPKVNINSATVIRTRLLRFRSPSL